MENAGKEDMPDDAERRGLGTPATRAAIIEKLVSGGFVERKGKNLIPTKAGVNLVTVSRSVKQCCAVKHSLVTNGCCVKSGMNT